MVPSNHKMTAQQAQTVLARLLAEAQQQKIVGEVALRLHFANGELRKIQSVRECNETQAEK